jgi:hypothetical protein
MEHTIDGRTYILVQQTEEELDAGHCTGCVDDDGELNICTQLPECAYHGNGDKVWKEKPQQ